MEIPEIVKRAFAVLSDSSAYLYGRSVRELLMGIRPRVYRIITAVPLSSLRRMFPRGTVMRGKLRAKFEDVDLILVSIRPEYRDSHFAQSFTIDSAIYSDIYGFIDNHGAAEDIKNKIIRLIEPDGAALHANPAIMLRAVRLCAELDFEIEENTAQTIRENASRVRYANNRAIARETDRLLMSPQPDRFRMLHEMGVLRYIMPQLDKCFGEPQRNKYHIYDVGEHIMHTVKGTPRDYVLRWAALLHDVGKPMCSSTDNNGIIHFYGHHRESRMIADDILHRYGIDRDAARDILMLVENHDVRIDPSVIPVKRMMCRMGAELFDKLMLLQAADNMAKDPKYFPEKYSRISAAQKIAKDIAASGEPYSYSQLVINSRDLQKRGIRPGRETNEIMRRLMDEVIADPSANRQDHLLRRAREMRSSPA